MSTASERNRRWRLILGQGAPGDLRDADAPLDRTLAGIYGPAAPPPQASGGRGAADTGTAGAGLTERLADIRALFPDDVVPMLQYDMLSRTELRRIAGSPEALSALRPDPQAASLLLAMRDMIPRRAGAAAREYVRSVIREMRETLEPEVAGAVRGALSRRAAAGRRGTTVDLGRTVRGNLHHYDPERGCIVPDRLHYAHSRKRVHELDLLIGIDQSASMADSALYAAVMGAILCSIPALDVQVAAFDHRLCDLTEACRADPVDALFGLRLGGGTDIAGAADYLGGLALRPDRTLLLLVTDCHDAGGPERLVHSLSALKAQGVTLLVLLALGDRGAPDYNTAAAGQLTEAGIICAACPPGEFADLLGRVLGEMRRA